MEEYQASVIDIALKFIKRMVTAMHSRKKTANVFAASSFLSRLKRRKFETPGGLW
jgi:hypothetical protein